VILRAQPWQGRWRIEVTAGDPSYYAGVMLLHDAEWEEFKAAVAGSSSLEIEELEPHKGVAR
jgi:hypothetical protein